MPSNIVSRSESASTGGWSGLTSARLGPVALTFSGLVKPFDELTGLTFTQPGREPVELAAPPLLPGYSLEGARLLFDPRRAGRADRGPACRRRDGGRWSCNRT